MHTVLHIIGCLVGGAAIGSVLTLLFLHFVLGGIDL